MIFVIDDDKVMAECIARAVKKSLKTRNETNVQLFQDGILAMEEIAGGQIPDLIFLDVMLNGPDGFTFLNEMISYTDTARVPIVIVSSIDFSKQNLEIYGVVGTLLKDSMTPEDIGYYVRKFIHE